MYGSHSTAEDKNFSGTLASPAPAVAPGNSPTLNALERWLMSPEHNITTDFLKIKLCTVLAVLLRINSSGTSSSLSSALAQGNFPHPKRPGKVAHVP